MDLGGLPSVYGILSEVENGLSMETPCRQTEFESGRFKCQKGSELMKVRTRSSKRRILKYLSVAVHIHRVPQNIN